MITRQEVREAYTLGLSHFALCKSCKKKFKAALDTLVGADDTTRVQMIMQKFCDFCDKPSKESVSFAAMFTNGFVIFAAHETDLIFNLFQKIKQDPSKEQEAINILKQELLKKYMGDRPIN